MSTASSSVATYFLDVPRHCRLQVRLLNDPARVAVKLILPEHSGPALLPRLNSLISITLDGQPVLLHQRSAHLAEGEIARRATAPQPMALAIHGVSKATTTVHASHIEPWTGHGMPLTISELRQMGEFPESVPYPRLAGVDAKGIVFTDFHTHSSGELSGRDLLHIAAGHHQAYPLRLLRELGFTDAELPKPLPDLVERIKFQPMAAEEAHLPNMEEAVAVADLSNTVRKRLACAMDAPFDRQCTFADMERTCYRFRYPLAKQTSLLLPSLMKIGENYARQGVRYAEITMTGIEKPENLAVIHRAVARVKEKYGVDLRFLVGIPRTLPRDELHALVEKTKALAQSPYIVGADIIGYETNKTSHLMHELESLALWTKTSAPHAEFTLRVHAGENAKNPDNVYEVLQLALKHKVRVRVGHALHGLDHKSLALAARLGVEGLCVLEFNPDSNIALNNMDRLEQLPFAACLRHGIDFVLGTDGSGIYGTSAQQLGLSAVAGLLDEAGILWLKRSQEKLMQRQLDYSQQKLSQAIAEFPEFSRDPTGFVRHLSEQCQIIKTPLTSTVPKTLFIKPEHLPVTLVTSNEVAQKFKGRTPIVLAGASGNSWQRMSAQSQRETAIAIDLMAHLLNPEKVMFVHGRGKERGVVAELAKSLRQREAKPYDVLGLITEEHWQELIGERMQTIAPHLTHAELITRGFLYVSEALVRLASTSNGIVVVAGGAAFTRDVILNAKHADLPIVLVSCAEGASQDKAAVMPQQSAPDAKALAAALYRHQPHLFMRPLNDAELAAAYQASTLRIDSLSREVLAGGGLTRSPKSLM
ncbi:MAG: hypothetical protein K2Q12_10480 [Rickettsiales bacterium]|nr:hypothetical protein [Rickettsiales bacterium]